MNLVQVCPCPFPSLGGPAKTFQQFHEAIGAQTLGFLNPQDGLNEKPVVPLAATVRTLGGLLPSSYYYAPAWRLREAEALIAGADCVFVHNFFLFPAHWTMQACRRHGVPYVVVLHGILDPWALLKNRLIKQIWIRLFGARVLRHASAVLCATQREGDKAVELLAETQTKVVKWACELPDLATTRTRREAIRRKLGWSSQDRVLVFLGRLHSMKKPLETVRLLAGLSSPKLKLLVVGPEWDVSQQSLEAEAKSHGWNGLRVVGPVFGDGKNEYLAAADGYISLSHRENFNYTAAEALASGLPVILSPGNDLGWEFAEAGFSWQLKTNDPVEARAAVQEFLDLSDAELAQKGQAARRWAEDHLSMARFRCEMEQTVAQVVAGRGAPRSLKSVAVAVDRARGSLGRNHKAEPKEGYGDRPLRILHYTPYYAPAWSYGGPPRSISALCEALAAHGHEVTVFTTNGGLAGRADIPTDRSVTRNGVTVHYFPATHNVMGLQSPELEKTVTEHISEFDLLHVTGVWQGTSRAACRAALRSGKPYVCSPRGALGWYSLKHKLWKKIPYYWFWERTNLKRSAALHFTSSMESKECRRLNFRVPSFIAPNCVNVQVWNRDESGGRAWRQEHKIGEHEFVLLYTGRFHHKKGLDLLPKICTSLVLKPDWRLVLVGFEDDGSGAMLRRKFEEMGRADRLLILPGVGTNELPAVYSGADVFVFPSRHENFGNVAIEALACGCPVMMSDQVGVADQVAGLAGVSVLPLEATAWVARLCELMTSRNDINAALIRSGVVEKFSPAQVAAKMEEAYFKVLEEMR